MFQHGTWRLGRSATILVAALLLSLPSWAGVSVQPAQYGAYYGNYLITPQHLVGIDNYISEDSGESIMLFSDYQSGIVRRLFPISDTESVMGPGFNDQNPVELHVRFIKDGHGALTGISNALEQGRKHQGFSPFLTAR